MRTIYSKRLNFWLCCRSVRKPALPGTHSGCSRPRYLVQNPIAKSIASWLFCFLMVMPLTVQGAAADKSVRGTENKVSEEVTNKSVRVTADTIPGNFSNKSARNGVDPALAAVTQQLNIERERNAVANDRLKELQREKQQQMQSFNATHVEMEDVRRAELDINLLQVDLSAVTLTLTDVEQTIAVLSRNIQDIKLQLQEAAFAPAGIVTLSPADIEVLNKKLELQQQLLQLQKTRRSVLREAEKLVRSRLDIQQEWKFQLEQAYQSYEHEKRQRALDQLERSMQSEQQQWIEQLALLNKKAKELVDEGKTQTPEYASLTLRIFEAEERGNMSQLQSNLMRLRLQLSDDIAVQITHAHSINDWNSVSAQIDDVLIRLGTMRRLLEGKVALIQQRQMIESEGRASGVLDAAGVQLNLQLLKDLSERYEQQLRTVSALWKQAYNYQGKVTKNLRSAIARRQGLPGWDLKAWAILGKQLWDLPALAWDFGKSVQKQLFFSFEQMTTWQQLFFAIFEFVWLGVCLFLSRMLNRILVYFQERHWTATNILEVVFRLIRHNLIGIFVFISLLCTFWITDMPSKVYTLVGSIGLVWFSIQFTLDLSRTMLFGANKDHAGRDIKLYQTIRWMLLIGGIFSLFIILSYQLPVAYEVRDFFSRISMLFLLGIAFALLKGRKLILSVLYPYLAHNHHYLKRHYLKRIFHLLSLLFPIMLISNALVGLVGYLELSWTIAQYQAYFLLIFTSYLVARGLLRDVTEWSSGLVIRRLRNGWLWSEAILKPLDRIFHAGLVILATYSMFAVIESGQEFLISEKIFEWLQVRLLSISGNDVTLMMLVRLTIAIIILFWVARWSREFAYRWFFVRIKDIGLRNSLAVFSQYAAVVAGIFICFRIIGLSWVAFAAILTGLAIGIGFGLRDLANNFVSGILLLIERPIRKGDLVTIAGHEGEVIHIGMRSLTIYTSDRTEVIVPHAEAFSKTFTNWTLQDSIVRGSILINIARSDDLQAVQQALLQILKETPGVVSNPAPEVLLKDIDDLVMHVAVHYYLNLQVTPMRSAVRSSVLFAIWDCLTKMGIQPPHPQQDVYIRTLPAATSG